VNDHERPALMAFLYRREAEANEADLSFEAREVLHAVGHGKTEAQAAAEAGIGLEELRAWKRDPAFRAAIKRARREGPREAQLWTFDVARGRYVSSRERDSSPPDTPPQLSIAQQLMLERELARGDSWGAR
jgi:hypothetical protein